MRASEAESNADAAPAPPGSVWTRLPAPVRDLVTFAVLALFAFVPFGGAMPAWWLSALLVAEALTVVLLRRRWPMAALAVAVGLSILALVLGAIGPALVLPVGVATFTVALVQQRRSALIAIGTTIVLLVAATWLSDLSTTLDPRLVSPAAFVAAAGALGDATRSRRDYIAAITERALRAERTRESEAQHRVAEDRLWIARDLHDVVAHQIAVINLQAGVASSALKTDPLDAEESLRAIRTASRAVLGEIGDLLAMLRASTAPGSTPAELTAVAGLARLDDLVARFADVGLDVTTQVDGPLLDLPPAVDLVAYRVVQEGLTNAHKHGNTQTAALVVCRSTIQISIRLSNPRPGGPDRNGGPSGYGLQGVRERVESVRGSTRIDESRPDRFVLEVDLPLPGEPGFSGAGG